MNVENHVNTQIYSKRCTLEYIRYFSIGSYNFKKHFTIFNAKSSHKESNMPIYNAPLKDMEFILNDVFKADEFWQGN